jgi:hypothetical protein
VIGFTDAIRIAPRAQAVRSTTPSVPKPSTPIVTSPYLPPAFTPTPAAAPTKNGVKARGVLGLLRKKP